MTLLTYILNNKVSTSDVHCRDVSLLIRPLKSAGCIDRLRLALNDAINSEDDVICCVLNGGILRIPDSLLYSVYELVSEGIYSFYLSADFGVKTIISERLSLIEDIQEIRAFMIARPIFKYLLNIVEGLGKAENVITFASLLNVIVPSSFLVEKNSIPKIKLKIHIISTFRNAGKYLRSCWESIERQSYDNYKVYFVDDCSSDDGIDSLPNDERIIKLKNEDRKYALQNILDVLNNAPIKPNDIICFLDGDDMFSHKYVLQLLNNIYQKHETLFSYSMMRKYGEFSCRGRNYTQDDFENLRTAPWKVTHLRAFAFKLYQLYLKKDTNFSMLKDEQGDILKMPYDMALFIPLMELAGFKRTRFIPTNMYEYRHHDANDHLLNREMQYKGEQIVRNKPRLV